MQNSISSSTLLLGDIPVLGLAFNQHNTDQRRGAVLILVTPSRTTSLQSGSWARGEEVQQLVDLWQKVVDPATNAGNVARKRHAWRVGCYRNCAPSTPSARGWHWPAD